MFPDLAFWFALGQIEIAGGIQCLNVRVSSNLLSVNENIWDRTLWVEQRLWSDTIELELLTRLTKSRQRILQKTRKYLLDQSYLPRPWTWQAQRARRACRYLESRCWRSWIHPSRATSSSWHNADTFGLSRKFERTSDLEAEKWSVVIVCDCFQKIPIATDSIQTMVPIQTVAVLTSSSRKRQPEKERKTKEKSANRGCQR